jgi:hypothetical protein
MPLPYHQGISRQFLEGAFSELRLYGVLRSSLRVESYFCITDSAGWAVVMGSACRCTNFHSPSLSLKILVARKAYGLISSLAPILAFARSIPTT